MKRAILSVSDKSGLLDFGRGLAERGFELVSTGGTARALADALTRYPDDDPRFAATEDTGFGLSPLGLDPVAGVREATLALRAYARAGGTLESP